MSAPSISFNYGDENDAYYADFSDSGFSLGGGEVTKPEAAEPAASTLRISPELIAIGGAVALVVILLAVGVKR
jgi:fermentation-respiration switch protein FrsA (DUF1100 family)